MTTTAQATYPKYFRKNGKCVKVLSPTETRTIILPPDATAAERFSSYPAAERLAEDLKTFSEVVPEVWTDFLRGFYSAIADERFEDSKRIKKEIHELTKRPAPEEPLTEG
ncbi:MAG TPA: hypothetical protein VGK59_23820 [Ohtaekwangia sp.]